MDIIELAEQNQQNAWKLLDETGIIPAWERIGATVHLVGSLKSGLLMKSRDIDLHIYTGKLDITESFSVMQELAERLKLKEIQYKNLFIPKKNVSSGMFCMKIRSCIHGNSI